MTHHAPYWLPLFFSLGSTALMLFRARRVGWRELVARFGTDRAPDGLPLGRVVKIGNVPETGLTTVFVSGDGLFLRSRKLFGLGHRTVLVPWQAVSGSEAGQNWWGSRWYLINIDGTEVWLDKMAFDSITPRLPEAAAGLLPDQALKQTGAAAP